MPPNNALALSDTIFTPDTWRDDNQRVRINLYNQWLKDTGRAWHQPDLKAYRDYLLHEHISKTGETLAPASVSAYVSTVATRYKDLKRKMRKPIWEHAALMCIEQGYEPNPANVKAIADEIYLRWDMAIDPDERKVEQVEVQDVEDSKHVRLTPEQADELIASPIEYYKGDVPLLPLRDRAIMALALATGLREQELCDLTVDDLYQHLGGELSVRVTAGKGKKRRLVPYGENTWALDLVDEWLLEAGIESGYVFRGFDSRHNPDPHKRLTTRAVQMIAKRWGVYVTGLERSLAPHDWRRSYAKIQYDLGVDVNIIRQNLGHKLIETTLRYIGVSKGTARRGKSWHDSEE